MKYSNTLRNLTRKVPFESSHQGRSIGALLVTFSNKKIKGIELFKSNSVRILSDSIKGKDRIIKGTISSRERICSTMISRDSDSRITQAQCSCSYFRYHKLKQGPCRHIVALSLKGE